MNVLQNVGPVQEEIGHSAATELLEDRTDSDDGETDSDYGETDSDDIGL